MKPLTLLDAMSGIQMIELIIWLLACAFIANGIALIVAAVIQVAKGLDNNSWIFLGSAFLSIAAAIVLSLHYRTL